MTGLSTGGTVTRRFSAWMLVPAVLAFAVLVALGTWQVQRLQWKEALIASIEERIHSEPQPLADIERIFAETGDVDYRPVGATGTFLHDAERHFFATFDGKSGFFVYTPLLLADGRVLLVNRGFVPYDRKDAATRPDGQVAGVVRVTGLARNPLAGKPSFLVPDNDPAKNIFYWKDLPQMAATAGLPAGAKVLPFSVDSARVDVPGGIPVGGVTIVDLPNNHLQYAITWYGLALALLGVVAAAYLRRAP
jgi:surfeit locus 1 family protein